MRHQIPNGDLEQIVDRALTALLRDLTKQKTAAVEQPRDAGPRRGEEGGAEESGAGHADSDSRHIPAAVRRKVWARDGGRCAFVAPSGRRCGETGFLEYHHVVPYAHGGQATQANIELRCRAHNGYEAERELGQRASRWRGEARVREAQASYDIGVRRDAAADDAVVGMSPQLAPERVPSMLYHPEARLRTIRVDTGYLSNLGR